MICVIHVCSKDHEAALRNLAWARKLDEKAPVGCIVSHEQGFDASKVLKAAAGYFASVKEHVYHPCRFTEWPRPQNHAFSQVSAFIYHSHAGPFLWWEQDAVPIRSGWLAQLFEEYQSAGMPFLGAVSTVGIEHLTGVAIYPGDVAGRYPELTTAGNAPFDIAGGQKILDKACISNSIQHVWSWAGNDAKAPAPSFTSEQDLAHVSSDTLLFHRCKDDTLIKLLTLHPIKANTSIRSVYRSFYHSGDLGDVIYSLPTVKALGGGAMYLGPDNRSRMNTREAMSAARANLLIPLLREQEYISKASYSAFNPGATVDLNDFRKELNQGQLLDCKPGMNLARVPLKHWKLPLDLDMEPWLRVPSPNPIAPVVIARSPRYWAPRFDWKRVMELWGKDSVFVGTREEHAEFVKRFGDVPYFRTDNLLDVARVIAGADLFIGNQSCPYAIAMGLGKTSILEHNEKVPNCIFNRPNVTLGFNATTPTPTVRKTNPLLITAPVENFTGYGQLVHALCGGLVSKEHAIQVNAFAFDESRVAVSQTIKDRLRKIEGERPSGLLICSILEVPMRLVSGDVLLTMWEATRLSEEIVNAINAKAACVIVPTQWNASCFGASGVKVPMRVVPLGIDPAVYNPQRYNTKSPFRFGTAGRLAHAGARKGVEETIQTFLDTFPIEEDVEMSVKIFEDCPLPTVTDPRVVYHRRFIPQHEFVEWYKSLNCFVSLTKGEGWGLHIHQAMACARPVITMRASGQSEYITENNAMCCRFKWEEPDWSVYKGFGQWCIADPEHASELMRYLYENRWKCKEIGRVAAKAAARYTWERFSEGIEAVLKEFGRL